MRLRDARDRAGLSREELARRSGVAVRTLYDIEMQGVVPRRSTQRVVAVALGLRPADLWPPADPRRRAAA
jgi:transcriptional regulator with XRE-family HTH domain